MRSRTRKLLSRSLVIQCMEVIVSEPAAEPGTWNLNTWNHNVAYHHLVRRSVPRGGRDLLDVGCGRGRLARELSGSGRRVLGIDPSAEMIEEAKQANAGVPGLEFAAADFLTAELPPESFDFVSFVASLHHMDQIRALAKAAEILRPGGRVVVIGLARATTLSEELVSGLCAPIVWFNDLRPDFGGLGGAPTSDPVLGWHETRELLCGALPEATFHRRLYYRYSLRWTKPKS
jgi:SAM-dependent methyltransferase